MTTSIKEHEGKKYLRKIHSSTEGDEAYTVDVDVYVDVYAVLEAFSVACPARAHAIKKLLCAGIRGKGSELDDLNGALAAINRAIELQKVREQ